MKFATKKKSYMASNKSSSVPTDEDDGFMRKTIVNLESKLSITKLTQNSKIIRIIEEW